MRNSSTSHWSGFEVGRTMGRLGTWLVGEEILVLNYLFAKPLRSQQLHKRIDAVVRVGKFAERYAVSFWLEKARADSASGGFGSVWLRSHNLIKLKLG